MPRKKTTETTTPEKKPVRYLSRPEIAARIGVQPDSLNRYKLPPADVQIGVRMLGWLPETIDTWNTTRPGKGWRKKPDDDAQDGPTAPVSE